MDGALSPTIMAFRPMELAAMEAALPVIMIVLGALGLGCLAWVILRSTSHKPKPFVTPPKRKYEPPPNDEDVNRMVAALQKTAHQKD